MNVDGSEFVRRFLQHVLPTGFQKVRHYGFLSPNSRVSLEMVRWLIALYHGLVFVIRGQVPRKSTVRSPIRCAFCDGLVIMVGFVPYSATVPFDTS